MRDEEPSKSSDKYGVDIRGVWILDRFAVGVEDYLQGTS